jgi:hypothetical protein
VIGAEQPADICSQSEALNSGVDVQLDDEVRVVDRMEGVVNGNPVRSVRGLAVETVLGADIHGVSFRVCALQGDGQYRAEDEGYFAEKFCIHRSCPFPFLRKIFAGVTKNFATNIRRKR